MCAHVQFVVYLFILFPDIWPDSQVKPFLCYIGLTPVHKIKKTYPCALVETDIDDTSEKNEIAFREFESFEFGAQKVPVFGQKVLKQIRINRAPKKKSKILGIVVAKARLNKHQNTITHPKEVSINLFWVFFMPFSYNGLSMHPKPLQL